MAASRSGMRVSPSPRPSPAGRGGIVFRLAKQVATGLPGGALEEQAVSAGCSLSLWERVRGSRPFFRSNHPSLPLRAGTAQRTVPANIWMCCPHSGGGPYCGLKPVLGQKHTKYASHWVKSVTDWVKSETDLIKSKADLIKSKTDLTKSKTDLIKSKTDLTKSKTDLTKSVTDLIKSETDLTHSTTDFEGYFGEMAKNSHLTTQCHPTAKCLRTRQQVGAIDLTAKTPSRRNIIRPFQFYEPWHRWPCFGKSGRGSSHSKTLARGSVVCVSAKRFGVLQSSGALAAGSRAGQNQF